jgi:hypothetical protein
MGNGNGFDCLAGGSSPNRLDFGTALIANDPSNGSGDGTWT